MCKNETTFAVKTWMHSRSVSTLLVNIREYKRNYVLKGL